MLRKCLKEMCGRTVKTREGWSVAEMALFHHPPILDINPDLPMSMVKQFMSCEYNVHRRSNIVHRTLDYQNHIRTCNSHCAVTVHAHVRKCAIKIDTFNVII